MHKWNIQGIGTDKNKTTFLKQIYEKNGFGVNFGKKKYFNTFNFYFSL